MARARNIKPGFFKNEVLAELPAETRLLFVGLWTLADREGRLEDRPKRIRAELFAFDGFDVDSMLNQLQANAFLTRYEADGKRYIQIENFVKHQDPHYKEKASEIPAPDGRENLVLASGVTRTQRARILERDGFMCQGCGSKEHLCIDHILPVSRGGDSSDENLQTLCLSCNTKKGNKLGGEIKNSYFRRDRPDFESKLIEQRRALPSDSLSSDSGLPDSLIPDSLIADTGFLTASKNLSGQPPAEDKPTAKKVRAAKQPKEPKPPAATAETWEAYCAAYRGRYNVDPVRNAMVNGQLSQVVARLGAADAPAVAAFYLSHKNRFYVEKMHPVGLFLSDAEKLRTEWATNRQVTATQAMQADRTQTNFNAFAPLLAEAEGAAHVQP